MPIIHAKICFFRKDLFLTVELQHFKQYVASIPRCSNEKTAMSIEAMSIFFSSSLCEICYTTNFLPNAFQHMTLCSWLIMEKQDRYCPICQRPFQENKYKKRNSKKLHRFLAITVFLISTHKIRQGAQLFVNRGFICVVSMHISRKNLETKMQNKGHQRDTKGYNLDMLFRLCSI